MARAGGQMTGSASTHLRVFVAVLNDLRPGGYMLGYQFGISYMSSALARVIESVLPGGAGLTLPASKRGGG
jgi:hypothetical protein